MADELFTTEPETWRDIPEWEGLYAVSDQGRVKSLRRVVPFLSAKSGRLTTLKVRGCILRPNRAIGYLVVQLNRRGRIQRYLVHRLVLLAFRGECPDGMEGAHLNGNGLDSRLSNLAYVTHLENVGHTAIHGTRPRGETQGLSKLSEADVRDIRAARSRGRTHKEIARAYGVARSTIGRILNHEHWRHVA